MFNEHCSSEFSMERSVLCRNWSTHIKVECVCASYRLKSFTTNYVEQNVIIILLYALKAGDLVF